jgi:NAD(P)H-dependent FMN reductase
MKLTVINGSPRGKNSNTKVLTDKFVEGFSTVAGNSSETLYLNHTKDHDKYADAFVQAECVLLAFPLYADSVPALVKSFIEKLEPYTGKDGNPPMGFLVHSGFPENTHSRMVVKYLEKLTRRLNCKYIGSIIKPDSEGIQITPALFTRALFGQFRELGRIFARSGQFDEGILKKLEKKDHYSKVELKINEFVARKMYWDKLLKKNRAADKVYSKPYA